LQELDGVRWGCRCCVWRGKRFYETAVKEEKNDDDDDDDERK
jgi:hypothetical protein